MEERKRGGAPTISKFRSLRQEGVISIVHTADVVRRQFARLFEPYGLTLQQYNVLRILRGARPAALPTMDIAERMIEQTPGITRLLDRLDEKGLVSRARCTEDRRQVLCTITAAGLDLLDRLDGPVDATDDAILEHIDDHDVEHLIRILARVRQRHS
jgi:DNA-binding MarR family transcriptional regulator